MWRFLPFILAAVWGYGMFRLSMARSRRELDARSTRLVDPDLTRVTDRMARALDLPTIKVHLYDVEPINGLAAPDGRIFITRGFYDRFRAGDVTAEEMASVIAHELGHVALGHTRRRMIDFSVQNALRTGLMIVLGRFLPMIGPWVAMQLVSLIAARLSRQDEFEADAYASALMIKSGIGVAPQIALFEKLPRLTGHRGGGPVWLMSHPSTEDRIRAISKNESKWLDS